MMTSNKISQAFAACRAKLPAEARPQRGGPVVEHLVFMCEEGASYSEERREKAMRWLGFVQGALWMGGLASIEELKSMNKPDNEEMSLKEDVEDARRTLTLVRKWLGCSIVHETNEALDGRVFRDGRGEDDVKKASKKTVSMPKNPKPPELETSLVVETQNNSWVTTEYQVRLVPLQTVPPNPVEESGVVEAHIFYTLDKARKFAENNSKTICEPRTGICAVRLPEILRVTRHHT